jgi:hypothetical protein
MPLETRKQKLADAEQKFSSMFAKVSHLVHPLDLVSLLPNPCQHAVQNIGYHQIH